MRMPLMALVLITLSVLPRAVHTVEPVAMKTVEAVAQHEPTAHHEVKQALARFAQERNEARLANEQLRDQRWLLVFYAAAMTLLAGWFGIRLLARPRPSRNTSDDTAPFAEEEGTGVAKRRKNATITIRNGATQEAEVVERVQTRRYFSRSDTAADTPGDQRRNGTTALTRRSETTQAARPTTRVERRTETPAGTTNSDPTPVPHPDGQRVAAVGPSLPGEMRPATVRVEHRSDRLEQVALKPGTAATARTATRGAFTLIEVMISVAVLATVLMAAFSGTYTLRQVQRANQEQSQVEELAASMTERIMGANWDWLGRERPDEESVAHRKGAWSWHRREHSQTYLPPIQRHLSEDAANPDNDLVVVGLLRQKTGIQDLKVYLEYYRADALDEVFNAGNGQAPYDRWQAMLGDPVLMRDYILPESQQVMDLREESKAVVVRILITWSGYIGGTRRHELVFARRK